ncbi:MAG: Ca-activated chloride channel family protein [Bacteroidia bacterium]|jgi:Ca-activated chloride channel family protein
MNGIHFEKYIPKGNSKGPFDRLFQLFKELLVHTSGDVAEAIDWMNEIDREHQLTNDSYGMGDFIEDLKKKGYLSEDEQELMTLTSKMEQSIRKSALNEIFGKIRKSGHGEHHSKFTGKGDETQPELRNYQFGDGLEKIALTESLQNAQIRLGTDDWMMTSDDLLVRETDLKTQTSSVLMIDISHSMILYGEDRITPAKKVAMALAEYIRTKYPKDTLDIIVFGNDAWEIKLKDLPYLQVGPYHTNTVAGLQLAQNLLKRKRNPNKQILMITDGKPSCLNENGGYYQNSFGLDRKIVNKTLNEAASCRRQKINVTTFMIAQDPYLQQFISEFTEEAKGKAFYSGLDNLGQFVIHDYANNKRKTG